MARTDITPRTLAVNGNLDGASGATNIDATLVSNGIRIVPTVSEELFVRVTNTAGADKVVTVKKGVNPPAVAQGQGDLTVTVAATSGVRYIGPLESGRFQQADGSIYIDLESGHTGAIDVIRVKRA